MADDMKSRRVTDRPGAAMCVALGIAFLGLSSKPSLAGGYDRGCEAWAHDHANTGAKSGYAQRYQSALTRCMDRQVSPAPVSPYRKPVEVQQPFGCYPGAPRMYRGTLYCFD